jgi:hypothetical protein
LDLSWIQILQIQSNPSGNHFSMPVSSRHTQYQQVFHVNMQEQPTLSESTIHSVILINTFLANSILLYDAEMRNASENSKIKTWQELYKDVFIRFSHATHHIYMLHILWDARKLYGHILLYIQKHRVLPKIKK